MASGAQAAVAAARDEFLVLVADLRPELHRYCARITGSVIEGEDIVQDTLAKAFYALGQTPDVPPLRPWLFRIAHNAALDFLKSHGRRLTDPHADMADVAGTVEDTADPFATRLALARFLALPVAQRSAVILKDVLGHSLEETAATMETTVMAVKAALVRGRGKLRAAAGDASGDAAPRAQLDNTALPFGSAAQPGQARLVEQYAQLFNAGDWDGVRALIGEDCRLDLVSRSQRRGKAVGMYFTNYAGLAVRVRVVALDGQPALAAYLPAQEQPAYFILLAWDAAGRVQQIRDFRYVPYLCAELELADVRDGDALLGV